MTYLVIVGVLLLGTAVLAGLIAGEPEQKKPRLFTFGGAGVALLCGAALVCLLWLYAASCLELLQCFMPDSGENEFRLIQFWFNMAFSDERRFPWPTAVALVLLVLVLFGVAFNCRRTAGNIYIAFGGVLFFMAVSYICAPVAYHGFNALFLLYLEYMSFAFCTVEGIWAVAGLSLLMLVVWTVYVLRGRRKGWKVLLIQGVIAGGIYVSCWLLAWAVVYPYGWYIRNKVEKMGIQPYAMVMDLPPGVQELFDNFDKGLELPFRSVYFWVKKNDLEENQKMVPPDKREYTLKNFDIPEFEMFLTSYETAFRNNKNPSAESWAFFTRYRHYAHMRAGRAALFLETGQRGKILPELAKITMIIDELLNEPQTIIAVLIREAIQSIWYSGMVRLGPDGPEYAPVYREALDRVKGQGVRVTTEPGWLLYILDSRLHFKNRMDMGERAGKILLAPSVIAESVRAVVLALALEGKRAELEQAQVFEVPPHEGEMERMLRLVAIRGRLVKVMATTGLALKLYRSEKGVYPEKLGQLVPEYLDAVPVCPYTGEPLVYTSDGKAFRLAVADESQARWHYLDTERNY